MHLKKEKRGRKVHSWDSIDAVALYEAFTTSSSWYQLATENRNQGPGHEEYVENTGEGKHERPDCRTVIFSRASTPELEPARIDASYRLVVILEKN